MFPRPCDHFSKMHDTVQHPKSSFCAFWMGSTIQIYDIIKINGTNFKIQGIFLRFGYFFMDFNEEFSIFSCLLFIVNLIRGGNWEVFFSDRHRFHE